MIRLIPIADIDVFVSTRHSWHQIAEHVVAKARYVDDGRVELSAFSGGFATPMLSSDKRVRVDGVDVVVDASDGTRRARPTTIAAAAAFVGIDPGFPTQLYPSATQLQTEVALPIDERAASALAAWFAFTAEVLDQFAAEIADSHPSPLVLWPEHFDQAFFTDEPDESRRANYGASPGDAGHPEPYLYVGPFGPVAQNEFWNATHFNGAVLPLSQLVATADQFDVAIQFLRSGCSVLATSNT